ncbi:hypothetical protein A359_02340 [secondary endosymbiont of Ctenarytaina eucalypti]|uniref:Uncharacterized protein n=1 Tax=secondary endosymbiont of Ctenarytaina eucalypti TaxID=1199245 RepID=J3TX28_9ENTR|nr:hypothetical protein A359_02340 [secondary endosymbiont of Ctenarytaina eucalypti]
MIINGNRVPAFAKINVVANMLTYSALFRIIFLDIHLECVTSIFIEGYMLLDADSVQRI